MGTQFWYCITLLLLIIAKGVTGATFTFTNKCDFTVWPGILASAGSPKLDSTGFELAKGSSRSFQAPTGWSGRFWGRTGCNFDGSGHGSCSTGDCGSSQLECNGAGAAPPATLAEFTLGSGSQDFYDVSLVDGYNLPMIVEGSGGSGTCASTGCATDLNRRCPAELKVDGGGACKSACDAFGTPEYCCSGDYAYDDASSTFTCTGADYTITFCASLLPSVKSATDSSSQTTDGSGSDSGSDLLASSLLADLAAGDSTRAQPSMALRSMLVLVISLALSFSQL
ncbi:thaumatin-like protein 1 [Prunus yedoensis var. nudiflora]|uniref:Thaumatin-like protein 1 n=1 Tax=Prunus yedoensis var. nudiflora TaxID=2094558 RepID=A0A314YBQ2_PRUYE|nr:thaumatin-like protein 1 [Prunus yedoensis var. nudiflora]